MWKRYWTLDVQIGLIDERWQEYFDLCEGRDGMVCPTREEGEL
jgi:hypothetical protein